MSKFVQSKDVAWNFLGERIIAFTLTGERRFHDLNETAALVFQTLQVPTSKTDLVAAVVEEFDVEPATASTDVEEILAEMIGKKLVAEA